MYTDMPDRLEQLVQKHTGGKQQARTKQRKKKGKRAGKGAAPVDFDKRVVLLSKGGKATLLFIAAGHGRLGVLKRLLRIKGIGVNEGSEPEGITPLFIAAESDQVGCVAQLLAPSVGFPSGHLGWAQELGALRASRQWRLESRREWCSYKH